MNGDVGRSEGGPDMIGIAAKSPCSLVGPSQKRLGRRAVLCASRGHGARKEERPADRQELGTGVIESRAKVVRCVTDELHLSVEPTVGQQWATDRKSDPRYYRVAGLLCRGQPTVRRDPRKAGLPHLGENHRGALVRHRHQRVPASDHGR